MAGVLPNLTAAQVLSREAKICSVMPELLLLSLCRHHLAVGGKRRGPNPFNIKKSGPKFLVEAGGIEPQSAVLQETDGGTTGSIHSSDNSAHESGLSEVSTSVDQDESSTNLRHPADTSLHEKYAPCMHPKKSMSPELKLIVEAWEGLPEAVREKIVGIVKARKK